MEEEQLGGGYPGIDMDQADRGAGRQPGHCSQFCSNDMLRVYPSLDRTWCTSSGTGSTPRRDPAGPARTGSVLAELGVDPNRPMAVFVGRIAAKSSTW